MSLKKTIKTEYRRKSAILAIAALLMLFSASSVFAFNESDSFQLGYSTISTGSQHFESNSFQVQEGIGPSGISTNSTSGSFSLVTINAIPNSAVDVDPPIPPSTGGGGSNPLLVDDEDDEPEIDEPEIDEPEIDEPEID